MLGDRARLSAALINGLSGKPRRPQGGADNLTVLLLPIITINMNDWPARFDPEEAAIGQRLDTEVGYGLPIGNRFVGTPRAGVRTSEYGRDYRSGYGMQILEQGKLNLQLGIAAERRESPTFQMQEQGAGARPARPRARHRAVVAGPGKAPEATTAPPRTGFRQAESAAGARSNGRWDCGPSCR